MASGADDTATGAALVELARRGQSLIEYQLRLLDRLEAVETDPDRLADLFHLDHLITRVLRNEENLLILAGGQNVRRAAAPVALGTVMLAAVAEIEQYTRVDLDVPGGVRVDGAVVIDLAHLLAELLEHATRSTPPDDPVTLTAGWTDAGPVTIVITGAAGLQPPGRLILDRLATRLGVLVEPVGRDVRLTLPAGLLSPVPPKPDDGSPSRPTDGAAGAGPAGGGPVSAWPADDPPPGWPAEPDDDPPPGPAVGAAGDTGRSAREAAGASHWWTPGTTGPDPTRADPAPDGPDRPTTAPDGPDRPVISAAGLPVRIPTARRPDAEPPAPTRVARTDLDPAQVGSALSALYDGVRRAETEQTSPAVERQEFR